MYLALLSGVLVGTSYIPFPPWALFFCWVPLWLQWLKDPRPKQVFLAGWFTQFIFTLIGFHWVAYVAVEFGHLPWPLGILSLLAFASLFYWYVPVSGLVWAVLRKRFPMSEASSVLYFAFSYSFFELIWPVIFPWNMGYPWLSARWPGYHWADTIGFQGLSALTVALNVVFFHLWKYRRQPKKLLYIGLGFTLFLLAFNLSGHYRGKRWSQTDREIKILAVQANIGNLEKYYAEHGQMYQDYITDKYIEIARQGLAAFPDSELTVFPETAIPVNMDFAFNRHYLNQRVREWILGSKIPAIVGAFSQNDENSKTFNALFLFDTKAQVLSTYRKTILLAFGEYFPGAETFPFLKKLVPAISDFGKGSGPQPMELGPIKIGPQICYEGLYPNFSSQLSDRGVHFFVNGTNDSWYGKHFEPYQHLYMTLARAIEFRRPLMRVTNTGITTAILADGKILQFSPQNQEWFGQYKIAFLAEPPTTFFQRWGFLLPFLMLIFTLGAVIIRL